MNQQGYIGRKMRLPKLQDKPAIIIAAFGSSSRARAILDIFNQQVTEQFPQYEIFWAYTSDILRHKLGLPGLQETLSQVEAAGFRRAVVQPLHVFPGTEYQQMVETCAYFPGLRIILSETLLHRWDFVQEILAVVEAEFLKPEEGLNVLALHGTPLTADPVNIVYLGLERLVADYYPNVICASIEGVPSHVAVLRRLQRQGLVTIYPVAKIIPMMFLAGLHAEDDLMGEEGSWRVSLETMGFTVQCAGVNCQGEECFKGLAHYPEVTNFLLARLHRGLELVEYF